MRVTKCDLYKKKIKQENELSIGYNGYIAEFHLCGDCGKPILVFLKKNGLIDHTKG